MCQPKSPTDTDLLRASINNETSQISWAELQRFFAGGRLIYVTSRANLLDVAVTFVRDDTEQVNKWLNSKEIVKVTDEQAKQWQRNNTGFWATVVKPWILIQPVQPPGIRK